MAANDENPFLISLPPGLLPARESEVQETTSGDSATRRISPPREPIVTRPPVRGIPFVSPTAAPVTEDPAPAAPPAPPVVAPTIAAPPPAAPVAEPDNDETRIVAPRHAAQPTWKLALPDGQAVSLTGALFIGRNPTRTAGDIDGDLLPVADTTRSVSKTHAVVEVLDGALWVTDLNSTNGVFVTAPDTDDVQAVPMERTPVPAGSDIELGEFIIQVEKA